MIPAEQKEQKYKRDAKKHETWLHLQDCAEQAGQESRFIYIEELGLGVGGVLTFIPALALGPVAEYLS